MQNNSQAGGVFHFLDQMGIPLINLLVVKELDCNR